VTSGVAAVWQPQSPDAKIAAATVNVTGLAEQDRRSNCGNMYFDLWSATRQKCSQLNPKFWLSRW
jgi:hypothetical protein